jgi:hypothetical protein
VNDLQQRPVNRLLSCLLTGLLLAACRTAPMNSASAVAAPRDAYWNVLESLCQKAFEGRVTESSPADSVMRSSTLIMHVRSCSPSEIRIPFHVGLDRSRTWVITRTDGGLRLKHDHRHSDGSEDSVTQYGGDTKTQGSAIRQEFYADAHTATLIPAAKTNVWTIEVDLAARRFIYALRREGTDRRFRVEFDLARPVPAPPPPWGASAE